VTLSESVAIAVDHLSHSYTSAQSTTAILNGLSLRVVAGETVALIGRSGSGKSTLLNLISGLEPLTSGEVTVHGECMSSMDDSQRTRLRGRNIGFIYQAFNLIPTLNVADNVALPLALSSVSIKDQHTSVEQILQAVGLKNRGDDYPDTLSGGEQQRVAIARALVHRPALILADEPTGNLDAKSGRQVLGLLRELTDNREAALLLVTHSVEVASVADRVLVLDQGSVLEMSPEELQSSPAW